jgi:hypothetical protein
MPDVRSRGRAYGRAANEPKPRSDAYTGLLLLSLLAQVAGAVFLYLDWSRYPSTAPQKPQSVATASAAPGNPAPSQPPGNPPGNPPVNPPGNPPMNPPGNAPK